MSRSRFEETVLPHLDAALNYARWLTRNDADADDVVQDAYVRALRYFATLRTEDARPWLLTIVRNAWYSRFRPSAAETRTSSIDDTIGELPDDALDPEARLMSRQSVDAVRRGLESLPVDFREVLVLRELEGLSYKEIAAVIGTPIGTVMSRLARARERLHAVLCRQPEFERMAP